MKNLIIIIAMVFGMNAFAQVPCDTCPKKTNVTVNVTNNIDTSAMTEGLDQVNGRLDHVIGQNDAQLAEAQKTNELLEKSNDIAVAGVVVNGLGHLGNALIGLKTNKLLSDLGNIDQGYTEITNYNYENSFNETNNWEIISPEGDTGGGGPGYNPNDIRILENPVNERMNENFDYRGNVQNRRTQTKSSGMGKGIVDGRKSVTPNKGYKPFNGKNATTSRSNKNDFMSLKNKKPSKGKGSFMSQSKSKKLNSRSRSSKKLIARRA